MFWWQETGVFAIVCLLIELWWLFDSGMMVFLPAGSHASRAREPGQTGNRAAISGRLVVCGLTRPIFFNLAFGNWYLAEGGKYQWIEMS